MTIKPDLTVPVPDRLDRVHFVGIGGSGMSGIARLFIAKGAQVSGSDRARNAQTDALIDLGATVAIGHAAGNIADCDAIVVTSALWPDNPELVEARRRGIPVLHRSQALAALTRGHRVIAVAGAHGKTTSTGMLVTALARLGADPSFVNGGIIREYGVGARIGGGDLFVIEADESDGSFLLYDTAVALITNVDPDHLDHYGSREAFDAAFVRFADAAKELAVISADDAGARRVGEAVTGSAVTWFGSAAEASVRMSGVHTDGPVSGVFEAADGRSAPFALRIPGAHNALNATGVLAVLLGLGYGLEESSAAIATFGGTKRRFDLQGIVDGVSVYDDYAHHPTEVDAALTAARTVVGDGRIIAVHQPHLYSRTQLMAGEFAEVLGRTADHTIVLDIDGAREDPVPGVTGVVVAERFADPAAVDYVPDWAAAAELVAHMARPGDFVITLGCGNVYRIVPQLLASLESRAGVRR